MAKSSKPSNISYFFASCPKGCEELLANEISSFNLEHRISKGGVQFQGSYKDFIKVLLNTKIASRIFKEIKMFFIKDEKQILRKTRDINWRDYLHSKETFKINTILDRDANQKFRNSVYLSQLLKDSVCDFFQENHGERPNVDLKNPRTTFLQRIEWTPQDFRVHVYVDLGGFALDKRGYRDRGHFAPLRENLAAALVESTSWDRESQTFFDPMCGTGTLLIEAILKKIKTPPSYFTLRIDPKPYAFLRQSWFKRTEQMGFYEKVVDGILLKAEREIENLNDNQFFANDMRRQNIEMTKSHIKNCFGRNDFVTFFNEDFTKLEAPSTHIDVLLFNPPYGERLKVEDVNELYYQIGETLKNKYENSTAYVFTLHGDLRKNIRLKTSRKKEFFNGDLDCRLLEYRIN